ncbi:sigma-70 family RNA polymerase sigma factor [Methylobacterium oryzae]|uniref:sigma-70 family RNA polymerase sigma factor n=1 Tax=Methylobacterium oryzae TaxID=334852 RepID=UPI002F2D6766
MDAEADDPSGEAIELTQSLSVYLSVPLREYFCLAEQNALPPRLTDLITRFDAASGAQGRTVANEFRDDLIRALPALRTFALSLCGDVNRADDLVQETFVRAWTKWHYFTTGTNFTAWLFTIMRNQFYSDLRKRKREVEDADGVYSGRLKALPDQEEASTLRIVWSSIDALPVAQRQALLLVGAEGYTYEEAAAKLGCQVGTVKSRVSRARALLADTLAVTFDNQPQV